MQNDISPIGNGTPADLVDRLVKRVQKDVDNYWLEDAHLPEGRKPIVYPQALPDITYTGDENIPAVLVFFRGVKGAQGENSLITVPVVPASLATANIEIWFGIYHDDSTKSGWRISLDMAWRVAQDFIKLPFMGEFKLHYVPIVDIPSDEPHPYFYAMINSVWDIPMSWEIQSQDAFNKIHFIEHQYGGCQQIDTIKTL